MSLRPAALALTALALGTLLSCRQATQITVRLRGEGFECQSSANEPGYAASGVLARSQLTGAGDLPGPRADGGKDDCSGSQPVDLGSVVLVPESGVGPVEVLAIAAISPTSGTAPSIDECLGFYEAFLKDNSATCAPDDSCAGCIFARRSLGFVEYSNLDLTISLDNDCAGVLCEASKTCVPERGCVSAAVSCEGDSCKDPEGAAGAGGAGGGGGGAPPVGDWTQLEVPPGAFPYDVVGRSSAGEELSLYIAAGTHMLTFSDRDMIKYDVQEGAPKAYVAVAVQNGGTGVAAVGSQGLALGPSFTPAPPVFGDLLDFDIAWQAGHDGPDIARDNGASDFAGCVNGFGNQNGEPVCGTALFAVNASLGPDVLLGAFGSVQAWREGLTNAFTSQNSATCADWSIWGRARGGSASGPRAVGYAVRSESSIIRYAYADPMFAREDLAPVASPTPLGITIDAVWGIARSDGVDLYAVGERAGAGWLGRTQVDDDQMSFEGWQDLGIPPAFARVRSIWIGPDALLNDELVVVIVGNTESMAGRAAIIPISAL